MKTVITGYVAVEIGQQIHDLASQYGMSKCELVSRLLAAALNNKSIMKRVEAERKPVAKAA